jgi:pyridoxal phosphate enzyme (YggS family)
MTDGVLTNMLIGPQISPDVAALAARLSALRGAIAAAAAAAGRSEDSITLIAVSKGQAAESIRQAAGLGVRNVGESYLQEALPKRAQLAALALTWHFIGRLQANKTRAIAEQFDWVHGLERLQIAERLSAQRPAALPPLDVCIQVNVASEIGKAGVAPSDLPSLTDAVARLPRLRLRGLMCILPAGLEPERNLELFGRLAAELKRLNEGGHRLDTLSMGMSGDFSEAIAAGATQVRIGTALFGPRQAGGGPPGAAQAAPPTAGLG